MSAMPEILPGACVGWRGCKRMRVSCGVVESHLIVKLNLMILVRSTPQSAPAHALQTPQHLHYVASYLPSGDTWILGSSAEFSANCHDVALEYMDVPFLCSDCSYVFNL